VVDRQKNTHQSVSSPQFPIVGIGASAGGLEAYETFFKLCPYDLGMAFVLVPHLAPDHISLLPEILQPCTKMPIETVSNCLIVKPNHVYIIPPNFQMNIVKGCLYLTQPEKPHGHRMLIDDFFNALALDQGTNAIGIILSGTGSDGTLGLSAIYHAGGTTFAQDPTTAKFDGMPKSAINARIVTRIANIDTIIKALIFHQSAELAPFETNDEQINLTDINQILAQTKKITGHDFSLYKKSTINRRIQRRMLKHNFMHMAVYASYLKTHPDEARFLLNELLINVTSFFRDKEAFDCFEKEFLPALFKNKSDDDSLRIWVAGCSTGEEAYSIAILIYEQLQKTKQRFDVQIFATDLDENAIHFARAGAYSTDQCLGLSQAQLACYFTPHQNGHKINKVIREMIIFAVQNVVKDPPFTKLDLLTCRNLMIYLESELQNRLIKTFHYALMPNGLLFLSPSESIGSNLPLFKPIDRKWKIYASSSSEDQVNLQMNDLIKVSPTNITRSPIKEVKKAMSKMSLAEFSRRILVQFYAPASVITDFDGNILYVHGETGKYLRPAPGQASLNIIEMARDGLEMELRTAIQLAANQDIPTLNHAVKVKTNGDFTPVSLNVRALPNQVDDTQKVLLISFIDIDADKPKRRRNLKLQESERVEALERDLICLKENYQVMIEEQQSSNEELKSTNEELQSTNEEMQSTNEELETSKEELQSVNEELTNVNNELRSKIELLHTMQNDMKNLLDSTNIGIIFMNKHLNIRSFTREATRFYRLVLSDVGRALSDIKMVSDQVNDDLIEAARQVLETLIPHEREIEIDDHTWVMVRIQPYRTLENYIDGVVMTFTDISLRMKITQNDLVLANSIVNTVREPLIVLDASLTIVAASGSFYQHFHLNANNTIGLPFFELGNHQWNIPVLRIMLDEVISNNVEFDDFIVSHNFINIGPCQLKLNARRIINDSTAPTLILLAIEVT
jgi:two-component system CheB/CheR fusion protein